MMPLIVVIHRPSGAPVTYCRQVGMVGGAYERVATTDTEIDALSAGSVNLDNDPLGLRQADPQSLKLSNQSIRRLHSGTSAWLPSDSLLFALTIIHVAS